MLTNHRHGLRLRSGVQQGLQACRRTASRRLATPWTRTFIIQDAEGREHHRGQGHRNPKRFLAEMALARLKDALDRLDVADSGTPVNTFDSMEALRLIRRVCGGESNP